MILTCPDCETRFAVADDKLRPDGRRVKCGKCGHVWFAEAPPAPDYEFDHAPIPVTPLDPVGHDAGVLRRNLPAMRRPESHGVARAAWLVVELLIGAVAAIVWFGREPIARAVPEAERVYTMAGIPVFPPPGEGLSVDFSARSEDGALMLRGEVTNTTGGELVVPPLHVVVSDAGRQRLHTHSFEVASPRLGPGERVPFTTQVAPIPANAANVSILFTNPDDTE